MRLSQQEEKEIDSLDKSQREHKRNVITDAILSSESSKQLILSGAGTGKTFLFSRKIDIWRKSGVSEDKILVTSFINFIVNDLKRELATTKCAVHTLHKFAKILIHRYLGSGKNFNYNISNNFQLPLGCDELNIMYDIAYMENSDPSKIMWDLKKFFHSPNKYKKPNFFEKYLQLVSFYDTVTFDDLIIRATNIISSDPDIIKLEKIIIDEYQDFNNAEQQFVLKILEYTNSGIIAGDDDQSIYSMKGADTSGIIKLYKDNEWEKVGLPFCSRSKSLSIVKCASNVCRRQVGVRVDKSYIPISDNGNKVKIVELSQSKSPFYIEAEYIARQIDQETIDGWRGEYPSYLILGKSSHHLTMIAKYLEEKLNITVGTREPNIYNNVEVQKLYSYIQLLDNSQNNIAFRRLISIANDINDDKKNKIIEDAIKGKGFNALDHSFITGVNENLLRLTPVLEEKINIESKLYKISEILDIDSGNIDIKSFINSIKDKTNIKQILSSVDELIIEQKQKERNEIFSNPVQCLTIWGSKGLKADVVFVLGLEEGYLPQNNSMPANEEINLLYVAMTRAVEELHLLSCKSRYDGVHSRMRGNNGFKNRSIFLDWLPNEHTENYTFNKADFS